MSADPRSQHPRAGLLVTVVVALIAIGAACASTAEPPDPDSAGARLYSQHCARCHGVDAAVFADPARVESGVKSVIENGAAEGMPAFADVLTPEQIETLAKYIRGIGET